MVIGRASDMCRDQADIILARIRANLAPLVAFSVGQNSETAAAFVWLRLELPAAAQADYRMGPLTAGLLLHAHLLTRWLVRR